MKFQTDFVAIASMSANDAAKLVEFYDLYEFTGGVALCDKLFYDVFRIQDASFNLPPRNFDLCVDAAILAHRLNLLKSKDEALDFLENRLCIQGDCPYGVRIFRVEHIKKLQHMLIEGLFPFAIPPDTSEEEIKSVCFPKYFVNYHALENCGHFVTELTLKGAVRTANGVYTLCRGPRQPEFRGLPTPSINNRVIHFPIEKAKDGDWAIVRREARQNEAANELEGESVWKCPYSSNSPIPPQTPWIAVGPEKSLFKPTITYTETGWD